MPHASVLSRHQASRPPVVKALKSGPAAVSAEFSEFAYIVSHDLQGPARIMVEFSRLLLSDRAASIFEDEDLYLKLIIESGEKLQGMIMGLLAFSRLNAQVWQPEPLDMNALIKTLMGRYDTAFEAAGGRMVASDLPVVYADYNGVGQAVKALIDNALKFRRPDAVLEVTISAEKAKEGVVVCFSDNGLGIEPEFCAEIFKPLRKLHTDDEFPGTGMGLTLARKIIQAQGGDMWARPNADHGLSVFFALPQSSPLPSSPPLREKAS